MLIALTGGIGSGKSTVLDIFESLGSNTADTDSIVHKIYEEDQQLHAVLKDRWGGKVFKNSQPHRPSIAEIVFKNKQELEWLNNTIHPLVKQHIQNLDSSQITIIAVPLLYEVNWQNKFKKTISVLCDPKKQHERLLARGWDEKEISARQTAQINQTEKLARSDFGIINNWSKDFLKQQCCEILKMLHE
jgi:dephospho-CoA kinase